MSLGSSASMEAVVWFTYFYTTRKYMSLCNKKPRDRQGCSIRALVPFISGILLFYLILLCWLHPQACNMMAIAVQGIMSRHDSVPRKKDYFFLVTLL